MTRGERAVSVTCVSCMTSIGNFPPPMLIYKRKRIPDALKNGAPPCTVFEAQDSGWMDREIFVRWLQHFINNVKTSKAKPVLLVLHGHSSHTGNLHAIDLARDNGVMLLSLPPHTTHRLQPLDVSYFKPFNTYFDQASDTWLRSNPGRRITVYEVASLMNEAFKKAGVVNTASNGFKKTGLWPPNRKVFDPSDFIATQVACSNEQEANQMPLNITNAESSAQTSTSDNVNSHQVSPGHLAPSDNNNNPPVAQFQRAQSGNMNATPVNNDQLPTSDKTDVIHSSRVRLCSTT